MLCLCLLFELFLTNKFVWYLFNVPSQFLYRLMVAYIGNSLQIPANTRNNRRDDGASGSGGHNEGLPNPPPYTAEMFFAQFLGSQRNMENLQRHMEENLRNIAANIAKACDNRPEGGLPRFKDFMDTKPPVFTIAKDPL